MTERTIDIPTDWTANEIRRVSDVLYPPGDSRLTDEWTYDVCVRVGQLRSRLRGLADELDP